MSGTTATVDSGTVSEVVREVLGQLDEIKKLFLLYIEKETVQKDET